MVEKLNNIEETEGKEKSKENLQEQIDTHKEYVKKKEIIDTKEETSEKLDSLKELVDKKVITKESADKIVSWKAIDKNEIEAMFDKIDEIEDIKNVDKYLPAEYRITKKEYLKALESWVYRVKTLTKLDIALTMLSEQINPNSTMWMNLFSWFLTVLDKNLVLLQENTIDVKRSLEKVWSKSKSNKKLSLWEKIVNFFKEVFNIK